MDLSNIAISFQYGTEDETLRREVERNVRTIITTPIGTCPLYRDFAIDVEMVDTPLPVAMNALTVAIIDAIEKWEPRVHVTDISLDADMDGKIKGKVVIAIG